ncbi:hypothetical protein J27TS7_06930 [Paenibacillus dendritiformis]|nr:hypothetical protein J27TS7_06930 [Paenibacillus dendritiformis]
MACAKILLASGVADLIGVDRQGALVSGHAYSDPLWNGFAGRTNPRKVEGGLSEALEGADVFIGLSGPNVLKAEDVERMAADPIVFAMANPLPEIMPEEAEPHARVIATGRSDYPNQSDQ